MTSPWWSRNKGWLAALLPLIVLAIAASSHRLLTLYVPNESVLRTEGQDRQGILRTHYRNFDSSYETTVAVRVKDVQPVEEYRQPNGTQVTAATDTQLWQVDLNFSAKPDQVLAYCSAELEANGVRYDNKTAKENGDSKNYSSPREDCVPEDTPGPRFKAFEPKIEETTPPRPEYWSATLTFAIPTGINPQGLRLYWTTPEYLYIPF